MRVLAGKYKSKKIQTISDSSTRPMMSKVREAIFNSLQFLIEDKDVLDLYAGSGSCLLYTSPSPRDRTRSRMPSSA